MYKKTVLEAGNCQACPRMEDICICDMMIMNGVRCMNLDESLVYAWIGRDMFERRGGWPYFLKYGKGRKMVLDTGFISRFDYYYTIAVQLVVAMIAGFCV